MTELIRPGTRIIVKYKDRFLIVKEDSMIPLDIADFWDMPGGTLEKDETPQVCARRELKEETGITGNLRYLDSKEINIFGMKRKIYGFFLQALRKKVILSDEHSDYRWLTLAEFDDVKNFPGKKHYVSAIKRFNL